MSDNTPILVLGAGELGMAVRHNLARARCVSRHHAHSPPPLLNNRFRRPRQTTGRHRTPIPGSRIPPRRPRHRRHDRTLRPFQALPHRDRLHRLRGHRTNRDIGISTGVTKRPPASDGRRHALRPRFALPLGSTRFARIVTIAPAPPGFFSIRTTEMKSSNLCRALPIVQHGSILPIVALWESRINATDRGKRRIV